MRTDIKYISITGVLLLILLTACSEESGWENIVGTNKYLQIEGEIAGTDVVTKVTGDDLGTNIRFTEGDQIGFYSFHKNKCAGGTQSSHPDSETCDKEYLKNEPLSYSISSGTSKFVFISENVQNVIMNTLGLTFAYYPYSDAKPADNYLPADDHTHYIHIFNEDYEKKWRLSNRRYTHRYQATIFRCELYIWPSIFDGTDILRKRVHSRKK